MFQQSWRRSLNSSGAKFLKPKKSPQANSLRGFKRILLVDKCGR